MRRLFALVTSAALLATGAAWADPLYVQSGRAALLDSPSLGGGAVTELARGAELQIVERGDGWYRVRHGGEEGWISRLVVSAEPPMDRGSVFAGDADLDADNVRRRPSQIASAAAARGLAEEQRARARQHEMARYDLLEEIEAAVIAEGDVHAFHARLRGDETTEAP